MTITFFLASPYDVLVKIADLNHYFELSRKNINLKVTFKKHIFEGLNWINRWYNRVLTQWFNLGSSVWMVQKLLSNSYLVTKVLFVALKSKLSNYFCIKTGLNHFFFKFKFVHIVLYICEFCSDMKIYHIFSKNFFKENMIWGKWNWTSGC